MENLFVRIGLELLPPYGMRCRVEVRVKERYD